jgi:hypothetical protein
MLNPGLPFQSGTRSEVVKFRVEQHAEALKDSLGVLRFGTTNDTTESAEAAKNPPDL